MISIGTKQFNFEKYDWDSMTEFGEFRRLSSILKYEDSENSVVAQYLVNQINQIQFKNTSLYWENKTQRQYVIDLATTCENLVSQSGSGDSNVKFYSLEKIALLLAQPELMNLASMTCLSSLLNNQSSQHFTSRMSEFRKELLNLARSKRFLDWAISYFDKAVLTHHELLEVLGKASRYSMYTREKVILTTGVKSQDIDFYSGFMYKKALDILQVFFFLEDLFFERSFWTLNSERKKWLFNIYRRNITPEEIMKKMEFVVQGLLDESRTNIADDSELSQSFTKSWQLINQMS